VTVFHDNSPFSQSVVDFFTQHSSEFKNHHFAVMMVGDANATELLNQTHPMHTVPFFCFKGKSTHCHDLLEAKWNADANKTLAYVTKKLNPGQKYAAFVKEPSRPCCMNKMMKRSELGAFAYYGDKQSGSYRAFGKMAKKT